MTILQYQFPCDRFLIGSVVQVVFNVLSWIVTFITIFVIMISSCDCTMLLTVSFLTLVLSTVITVQISSSHKIVVAAKLIVVILGCFATKFTLIDLW